MSNFLGMRGSGDFTANEVPENWREMILHLYPNGMAPLTAMMSMMKNESLDSTTHHWWEKVLSSQRASITAGEIYVNASLTTSYVKATHSAVNGISGGIVYVKMPYTDVGNGSVQEFRVGHQVLLRDADQYLVDVTGKVVGRVDNGASSYIVVKLLEADNNHGTTETYNLSTVDTVLVIGNVNPQGGFTPDSLKYAPTELENKTHIFRTSLDITRTAKKLKTRTGNKYLEDKRECLEYHSIEMEKALIWSVVSSKIGANGKPETTMDGILSLLKTNYSSNVLDFRDSDATYNGKAWTDIGGGEDYLDDKLEQLFRYGRPERLALCGSGAMLGIQRLAKITGNFDFTPQTTSYGIKVITWTTPFGEIHLKTHPLFSFEPTNRNSMLLLDPRNLTHMIYDDTHFVDSTPKGKDGTVEEYITEATLEMKHARTAMYLNGIGTDNPN
jgi:hypothetical protein